MLSSSSPSRISQPKKQKHSATRASPTTRPLFRAWKRSVDDLVEKAIEEENTRMVETVLRSIFKAEDASPIPVPFEINGEVYTQIKKDRYSFEVTSDGENWRYLTDENEIRLYEALETAGCLDSIE